MARSSRPGCRSAAGPAVSCRGSGSSLACGNRCSRRSRPGIRRPPPATGGHRGRLVSRPTEQQSRAGEAKTLRPSPAARRGDRGSSGCHSRRIDRVTDYSGMIAGRDRLEASPGAPRPAPPGWHPGRCPIRSARRADRTRPEASGGVGGSSRVRLKRGAGAGCATPSSSTNAGRARLCGWCGASSIDSTGAKQASVPSSRRTNHRACASESVRPGAPFASGHRVAIHLRRHRRRIDLQQAQQFGVELGLDRRDRDVVAVGAFIDLVEVRAGVGDVGAARPGAAARLPCRHRSRSSARTRRPPWPHPRPGPCRTAAPR